ncbi:hypothetical protein [Deinococcus peraridilitoris]|uniref:DNA repair protein n=1 Tax=Deinococcus peraridilitoris (strain DSM 19664 / LMG 22246 / CIP 109416 / KR-200) TaxID=937777 RepID=L0A1P5_DEIPD|nr:hypothetical protein [Deinococcus peraridilitoris]AFZ67756.1 hypothetical protein Deipe_2275 [Deinococcus peraridilitoris DSM 19664]
MTKASKKSDAPRTREAPTPREDALRGFDALMATAGVESTIVKHAASGADSQTLNDELTRSLQLAHDRWGLGLLHLRHEARLDRGEDTDVILLVDGREVARLSQGAAAISATYETMRAQNADDLSDWGVLPEGHRVTLKAGNNQMRVLVEDARDFETHWSSERGGAFVRTWRQGETLAVEVHRPASPGTALADAAWDAIMSIKDRNFQRELMERSNSVGMLGALLGARHKDAGRALERLPEAHFAVRSTVVRMTGGAQREFDQWRSMVREGLDQLDELQKTTTRHLTEILRHGLK